MCFYTEQNASLKEVIKRFNKQVDDSDSFLQSAVINGFSYPNLPIIIDNNAAVITTDYTWALIPSWATNEDFRKNTLNARIETVTDKPSFKNSINNRCLIIATGFYEWHWNDEKGKSKEKYLINLKDETIFTFAGLYTKWINPNSGEIKKTYTMLTTEANETMSFIHNHKKRMPVILKKEHEYQWLDNSINIQDFAFPQYDSPLIYNQIVLDC